MSAQHHNPTKAILSGNLNSSSASKRASWVKNSGLMVLILMVQFELRVLDSSSILVRNGSLIKS
jgi:hypothetical protein